ncbi:polysaccharide biosynthesis protein [Niallia circulans]|uniref:Polysaccharide biosynthesis protein n=1 Tax=Niallia circulans TaxID=1397 RepID=A0A553SIK9_NIACI|nr:oligosaccharide flippase family protein [Niallia circulans]TRZ36828.1 polysaccharide biosynthesis protein [Niallia circulans]
MEKFIKKLVGFSLGPVIAAFIAFITIPITTYFIDPSEYGKASMFSLFQTMLGTFLYLGIDQSYAREYHSANNKLNLFQNAVLIPIIISIVGLIIILLFPTQTSLILFDSSQYILPSILFGIMVVAMVVERFILLSLRMQEKALEYSMLNILSKFSILVFTIIFVLFIRRDFLAVVFSTVLGQILADIYLLVRYRKLFSFKGFSIDKSLIKKMIHFGFPILIATSLSSVLNSFDRIALRTWSDFFQIGIFTATQKIAGVITVVQLSFTSFWVPTAYRWYEEGKEIRYFKIVSDSILFCMSILFVFVLIFKDIIIYVLSSGYSEAALIIAFLCLPPIIFTVSETTCLGIVFSRKSYLSIWVGVVAIIPNLIINFLLVPKYGALGAAIATAVSYVFFFITRTYFSNKNGMRFSTTKHNFVFFVLLIISFINIFEDTWVTFFNVGALLIVILTQYSTIKEFIKLNKKRKISKVENLDV